MGWRPASRRCLVFRPLLLPQGGGRGRRRRRRRPAPLEREAAERLPHPTRARDLGLDRTGGSLLVRAARHVARQRRRRLRGGTLAWAGSAFVGFLPVRLLFLPARAWGYVILPAPGAAAALGLAPARGSANAAAVAGAAAAPVVRAGLPPPPPPAPPLRGA